MRGGGIFQLVMPRQYFSILLLGIVTISVACLGLRWHVLAQLPESAQSPPVAAMPTGPATESEQLAPPSSKPAPTPAASGSPGTEDNSASTSSTDVATPEEKFADTPPSATSAGSAVQGFLSPQTKPGPSNPLPPAQQYAEKPKAVRVDINKATVTQLQALPGIGSTLAQRIVDYRKQHGPFKSVAELNNVKGIGEKKLADIKPWAYVGQ
jgi:competence protein ComEA